MGDITLTGPNAPVVSSSATVCAAHTKGFPESIATQTAKVACTTLDAEIYSAGEATLGCLSTGAWDADTAIVTTGCTLKTCSVHEGFRNSNMGNRRHFGLCVERLRSIRNLGCDRGRSFGHGPLLGLRFHPLQSRWTNGVASLQPIGMGHVHQREEL